MLSRQEAAALRKSSENETTVVVGMMVDAGGVRVVVDGDDTSTYRISVLVQPAKDNNSPPKTTATIRLMN
jgi:hypothetical protein